MALGFQQLNSGGINVPLRGSADSNVTALVGREEVIANVAADFVHLLERALARDIPDESLPPYQPRAESADSPPRPSRGRKMGSTNWKPERFWRKYAQVASRLRRPYRGTHLAAGMDLKYETFLKYFGKWGPPPGYVGPGE